MLNSCKLYVGLYDGGGRVVYSTRSVTVAELLQLLSQRSHDLGLCGFDLFTIAHEFGSL